jgi:hypothetical protein
MAHPRLVRVAAVVGAATVVVLTPAALSAQGVTEREVLATVERVFEGMRTADSAMVRSGFVDGARFALLDTTGTVRFQSIDGWVRAIANSNRRWQEPIYDVQVRVDGSLAQVWAPYTFYLDGAVRHCGVDAIELLKTSQGWKITQLSDTQRRDSCPDPLRKRPT